MPKRPPWDRQDQRIATKTWLAVLIAIGSGSLCGQEHGTPTSKPAHERTGPDQNGAGTGPTHAPQPALRPLFAWNFVMSGNAGYVAARRERARRNSNKLIESSVTKSHHGTGKGNNGHAATQSARPAGAGKYVCCVITCADVDIEIAPMLGLAHKHVLVLRLAGPFVNAEAIALVERTIKKHRLCLVLVLGHERCDSLRLREDGPEDALDRRVAAMRTRVGHVKQTLAQRLVETQRELILASSRTLHTRTQKDLLRIVPGVLNERTGAIAWQHRKAQQLPLSPVK